ncbi:MAG: response regulator transcription factor [Pseudomonadales bacterium]|nr:response regulator transcription factor [Pseudomonadales bacterium]
MNAVLISEQATLAARWSEAFPAGKVTGSLKQALRIPKKQDPLYWLDVSSLPQADRLDAVDTLSVRSKVVVLSPGPSQAEASQFIRIGAMGYCHLGTPVERLQEIALVLEHEGFWMPKEMIQRITQLTRRLGVRKFNPEQDPEQLTGRERAVADLIGLGANNAEIAKRLNMSERTVKAHLTSIFQQLNVRDRVQLALVMNQLPLG